MEHAHETSKGDDKAGAVHIQRNPTARKSSDTGAVLDLQRLAGNRAVARLMTGATTGRTTEAGDVDQSSELAPPRSVQRNRLSDAIETVKPGIQDPDFLAIARKLVALPATSSKKGEGAAKDGSGETGGLAEGQPATWKELEAREKRLKTDSSDKGRADAVKREIRDAELTEQEKDLKEQVRWEAARATMKRV